MLPNRDQCGCLEHRVKHPVPKVPFATGWLATGTNSPHARSAHIARTPPVTLPVTLASSPVTLAPSQVVLNQPQNIESIDTKFTDPTNHLKNQTQILNRSIQSL